MRALMGPDKHTLVISSYNFVLGVKQDHLYVKDGDTVTLYGRYDFRKSRDAYARVLILSYAGSVSLSALRFLAALDVPVCCVTLDGHVTFLSPGPSSDARLVKRQVQCMPDGNLSRTGLEVTRFLLTVKLAGQRDNLMSMNAPYNEIDNCLAALKTCNSVTSAVAYEGMAGTVYWREVCERIRVPWEPGKIIPAQWHRMNGRPSVRMSDGYPVSSNARAKDFANSCLNYGYGIGLGICTNAAFAMSLHAGIGLTHSTVYENRLDCSYDLLEYCRPAIDRVVFSYMTVNGIRPMDTDGQFITIERRCAIEISDGECRLTTLMTRRLSASVFAVTAPLAMEAAVHVAEMIAGNVKIDKHYAHDPRIMPRREPRKIAATVEEMIPDSAWNQIRTLVPESRYPRSNLRLALAAIIAWQWYGVTLTAACKHFGCHNATARRRYAELQDNGTWQRIVSVLRSESGDAPDRSRHARDRTGHRSDNW